MALLSTDFIPPSPGTVTVTSYAATVRNTSKSAQVTGTDYAATVKGSTHV